MNEYARMSPRQAVKLAALPILSILLVLGCSSVSVVRPLDPSSAAVKATASSVMLTFSIAPRFNDPLVSSVETQFEQALSRQLQSNGFTISHNSSNAEFSINVVLNDVTRSQLTLEQWGQVVYRADRVAAVTWDISYIGPGGIGFGAIQKRLGSHPVSFMTTFRRESDGSTQHARLCSTSDLDVRQAAREITEFTRKHLKNPPK